MKTRNPIEPIDRKSLEFCKTNIPNTTIPYSLPTNYTDINGQNPKIKDVINSKDIVFSKEQLTNDNWLFTIEDYQIQEIAIKKFKETYKLWIIIQTSEMIEEIKRKERDEKLEKDKKRRWDMDHFKFPSQESSAIEQALVVKRFLNTDDFKNSHSSYDGELINLFREGDEIWHYNERIIESRCGHFGEFLLLIRENKIIYSPCLSIEYRDNWGF